MVEQNNQQLYTHIIIGLLALSLGYPYGGTIFIAIMTPYLVYMVLKMDALFLPALILHCASETSAFTVVFLSIIVLSIWKYKVLLQLKLKIIFWMLITLLPIFIWLIWQRISIVGESVSLAFAYIGFYLSFFGFFYGVLIAKTFSKKILMSIYAILFIVFFLYSSSIIGFTRITVAFVFLFNASLAQIFVSNKQNQIITSISIFAFISLFFTSEESTFTVIFVSSLSFLIVILYYRGKINAIFKLTGALPFLVILFLYTYGIKNYLSISDLNITHSTNETIDFTSWTNFSDRLLFKFYGDRAPFWSAGFYQIIDTKSVLPPINPPNLESKMISGKTLEVTFGSHTTFIELIRKFGIFAGSILGFILIYMTILSRKVFLVSKLEKYAVPFFSMAIICTIIVSFAGQFEILPGYALLSLGVQGIAYGIYKNNITYL
jgi:hypothetical protein